MTTEHTFALLGAGWAQKPPAEFVIGVFTLNGSGFQLLLQFKSMTTRSVCWWWEIALLPLPSYLLLPIHLKLRFHSFVNKAYVMLSNKISQYMLCCHYCGRGFRCYLQRKSVLLLSEVRGSAVVPRCTVITAHCTDFLNSAPVFCWSPNTHMLLIT